MSTFPTSTAGLDRATDTSVIELADGDSFDLRIAPVVKTIAGHDVRMLSYNASVPGPTLRVQQGSEIVVNIVNEGDLDGTVHWHGLRLENQFDGTHETQDLIPVGGSYTARVSFPDPGVYWYHPHVREDYAQELGLYGNVIVEPADPDHWPAVHRDVALTLDDLLIEDGRIASFSTEETTHSAMGRFGNVLLVGGADSFSMSARWGEVVRFWLTNTANTRVFKFAVPDARMKLVGGDSGRVEVEAFVSDVTLAPSERVVVDVQFSSPGSVALEHQTPDRVYRLGEVSVSQEAAPALPVDFDVLRRDPELSAERARLADLFAADPDKRLAFIAEMDMGGDASGGYACPMHPEVRTDEPGHCPECGMKLIPASMVDEGAAHDHDHSHSTADGIEWEDDMVEVNRLTTPANTRWKLVDRDTGAENGEIDWTFRVGGRVKIRLLNEMAGDHPMHHPFHVHGAGRFLVLARDGEPETSLVWKDTVLLRAGETVDIMLEVTNPGRWMAHCHIAEHHESGMMFSFDVLPA